MSFGAAAQELEGGGLRLPSLHHPRDEKLRWAAKHPGVSQRLQGGRWISSHFDAAGNSERKENKRTGAQSDETERHWTSSVWERSGQF